MGDLAHVSRREENKWEVLAVLVLALLDISHLMFGSPWPHWLKLGEIAVIAMLAVGYPYAWTRRNRLEREQSYLGLTDGGK
jgi:hypothetical protein